MVRASERDAASVMGGSRLRTWARTLAVRRAQRQRVGKGELGLEGAGEEIVWWTARSTRPRSWGGSQYVGIRSKGK